MNSALFDEFALRGRAAFPDDGKADGPARAQVWEALDALVAPPDEEAHKVTRGDGAAARASSAEPEDIPADGWDRLADAMRVCDLPAVASTGALHCTDVHPELVRDEAATLARADLRPKRSWSWTRESERIPSRPQQETVRGSELRLVWGTRGADLACWFSATGPADARCGLRQVGDERGLLNGDDGLRDVYVSTYRDVPGQGPNHVRSYTDGYQVVELLSGAAPRPVPDDVMGQGWVHPSGALTGVAPRKGESVVYFPDRAPVRAALPTDRARWYATAPHWVIGKGLHDRGTDQAGRHENVFVLPLDAMGRPAGTVQHLGKIDGYFRMLGCRRPDGATTLVWIEAEPSGTRIAVAHPRSPTELAPIVLTKVDGTDRHTIAPWDDEMTCGPRGEPRWVYVDEKGLLHAITCTPAGCEHATSGGADRRFTPDTVVPVSDDELLEAGVYSLSYPPGTPPRFILGARRATLRELADAPLQVLLEEPARGRIGHAGPDADSPEARESFEPPRWFGFRPYARGDVAWITGTIGGALIAVRLQPGRPPELAHLEHAPH